MSAQQLTRLYSFLQIYKKNHADLAENFKVIYLNINPPLILELL